MNFVVVGGAFVGVELGVTGMGSSRLGRRVQARHEIAWPRRGLINWALAVARPQTGSQ
jgi:hypothetical protein